MTERITIEQFKAMTAKPTGKRQKYLNVRTTVDGITFDSKKEATRYSELKILEHAGAIADLVLQPRWEMVIGGKRVCTYTADFQYTDKRTGQTMVEDAKSPRTRLTKDYRIKVKLLAQLHGVTVTEV